MFGSSFSAACAVNAGVSKLPQKCVKGLRRYGRRPNGAEDVRTLVGLSLDLDAELVGRRRQCHDRDSLLQEGRIRRVDLDDQHTSTKLGGDLILEIDVESLTLGSRSGGHQQLRDRRLCRQGTGANIQVLADGDEIRVYIAHTDHKRVRLNPKDISLFDASIEDLR